ncbi:MAG: RNA-binding cell elongation regulator Jag/EloR [Bacillota bacterium]|nr:RNA-binding cell elongation regulator Jag/EloR [Bacillota bacterium]
MKGIEVRGRTADEAVAEGLVQLGLRAEQVDVAVLEPGHRGFLGLGGREAVVRLTPRLSAADLARRFLTEVVQAVGVDASVSVTEDQGNLTATLQGDDLGTLIGRQGHTLDALQYLLHVVISRHSGPRQVSLDIGGYRARREESIRRMARRACDEARRSGRSTALEPMSPSERRVVHLELQDQKDVQTESEGEEPYRRVVVKPTQPAPARPWQQGRGGAVRPRG